VINLPNVALWGLVATLALTTVMEGSQGLGLSRMSIPFMLGTMVTPNRDRAPALGFVVHLALGWVFALLYSALFESLHRATWWLGAAFGLAHGLVILVVVMPVLPGVHPRMASGGQGPEPTRGLEPPGFLALNYGRSTPLIAMGAHIVYGFILGGGYRLIA